MGDKITITGQIVDVTNGEIVASATVDGVLDGSFSVYSAFLFQLLDSQPGYQITIPFEAAILSLTSPSIEASERFAKALLAIYKKDSALALSYLEQSISGPEIDFLHYNAIASEYLNLLSEVEGQSFYTHIVKAQIEENRNILDQLGPITTYRNTLKIVSDQMDALVNTINVTTKTKVASQESWNITGSYVEIPLPDRLEAEFEADKQGNIDIEQLLQQQDIFTYKEDILSQHPWEPGGLLAYNDVKDMLTLSWIRESVFTIQFRDRIGNILYEITSNGPSLHIAEGKIAVKKEGTPSYKESSSASGWVLDASRGVLEVQARSIMNLASVHLVVNNKNDQKPYTFKLYDDLLWNSLIAHVTKTKTNKVFIVNETDTNPIIKDIILTDSVFYTGNAELDPVPILQRESGLYQYLDYWGFVYLAEKFAGKIEVAWGDRISDSNLKTGNFQANDWVFFNTVKGEKNWIDTRSKKISLKVTTDQFESTESALLDGKTLRGSTPEPASGKPNVKGYDVLTFNDEYIVANKYSSGVTVFDRQTEKILYSLGIKVEGAVLQGQVIYYYDDYYGSGRLTAFDLLTGTEKWSTRTSDMMPMLVEDSFLYAFADGYSPAIHMYDLYTGKLHEIIKIHGLSSLYLSRAYFKKINNQFVILNLGYSGENVQSIHQVSQAGNSYTITLPKSVPYENIYIDERFIITGRSVYDLDTGGLLFSLNSDGYISPANASYFPFIQWVE